MYDITVSKLTVTTKVWDRALSENRGIEIEQLLLTHSLASAHVFKQKEDFVFERAEGASFYIAVKAQRKSLTCGVPSLQLFSQTFEDHHLLRG